MRGEKTRWKIVMRDVLNFEGHQEKLMWTERRRKKLGNGELKIEVEFIL